MNIDKGSLNAWPYLIKAIKKGWKSKLVCTIVLVMLWLLYVKLFNPFEVFENYFK